MRFYAEQRNGDYSLRDDIPIGDLSGTLPDQFAATEA